MCAPAHRPDGPGQRRRGDAALRQPVTATGRIAIADVEIAGCLVHRGEWVRPTLVAANRDPAMHPEPGHFDITRNRLAQAPSRGRAHDLERARAAHVARDDHQSRSRLERTSFMRR